MRSHLRKVAGEIHFAGDAGFCQRAGADLLTQGIHRGAAPAGAHQIGRIRHGIYLPAAALENGAVRKPEFLISRAIQGGIAHCIHVKLQQRHAAAPEARLIARLIEHGHLSRKQIDHSCAAFAAVRGEEKLHRHSTALAVEGCNVQQPQVKVQHCGASFAVVTLWQQSTLSRI